MLINVIPSSIQMPLALGIFVLTYICLLIFSKKRAFVAMGSGLLYIILGYLPIDQIFRAIDWNVILMISGTMGLVAIFIDSKMPSLLADAIIDRARNVRMAIIALSLFAGIISAFIDNVATVLIVAPIALTIAKKLKINPVPAVIAIAVASNLEGAATLVGDTTSILLGGYANMDFLDFFFYQGHVGLFFIVQIGLLIATTVLFFTLKKDNSPLKIEEKTQVDDYFPTFLMLSLVVGLIIASFIPDKPAITNGLICVFLMLLGVFNKTFTTKRKGILKETIKEIDFLTVLLLIGLFLVIKSITNAGIIDQIALLISNASGGNIFIVYTIIVFVSVFLSAFIDNIPYVATMLPVISIIAASVGLADPSILYFGLLIGATLGGNLTPIGASANITAIGILSKSGYTVTTKEFMRIGVPYTISAVLTGYILIWIIF